MPATARPLTVVATLAALVLLPGCAAEPSAGDATDAGDAVPSSVSEPSTAASPAEGGSGDLADGTYSAYLGTVSVPEATVELDVVDVFFGDEAAARNGGEVPPNDYLVVNDDPTPRTLPVAPDAEITIPGSDAGDVPTDLADLTTDAVQRAGYWTVTVEDGTVTVLDGQYVP